ncbi:tetratricopeptide repeat protein [Streptomyces sp. NPDC001982]|uniref:tetratricopeptide repeat protein n=1 Tax=Streptomyces sp. NPDC001982 TaxID=3154405 RepID=UPI00331CA263
MQELIRQRRRAGFVGRNEERAAFRANLGLPPEDERHRFLFHVHGNAGVGKTFLVRELEQIARERGALTAYVDESAGSVPEAMAAIGRQFAGQGHRFKDLERLLVAHRERRYEAETAALAAPEGPSAGSMVVARAGLTGAAMVPVVGAFAGAVDPAQLAQGVDRLRAGLSARFRSQEDVQLVLSPEQVLTPVLLAELSDAASTVPWIVLFLDTYERTGPFLDAWLHELMTTDRYGALPATIVVVTAGQRPFDAARWGGFADFVTDVPLLPFTEAEARGLLADRGVVAEPVVEEVLRLSGGLPVLVSTLAETRPADPGVVGDPSATAVDRFLKWEQDPVRRAAALAGALPRQLDADVFRTAVECPEGEADVLFAWLRGMPFVSERAERMQYHDVVRAPMLRLQRVRSPRGWTERHTRLAEAFAGWRAETEADLPSGTWWQEEEWRKLRLAESYHLLCARPRTALATVLRDLVDACGEGEVVARWWAQALVQAGEDADADSAGAWGSESLAALDRGGVADALGVLLARGGLDTRGLAEAHRLRGVEFTGAGDHAGALAEFDRAVELDPTRKAAWADRGAARYRLGDLDAAVADLDRALELDPDYVWALVRRARVWRSRDEQERRLADLDRAVALGPDVPWVLCERGDALTGAGRYTAALADYDRAIARDAQYASAYASRGVCRSWMGDTAQALTDLDRALELRPEYVWALWHRGRIHLELDSRAQALADVERALALEATATARRTNLLAMRDALRDGGD